MLQRMIADQLNSFAAEEHLSMADVRILLAVSGGVDSMVLLHILQQLRRQEGFTLAIAHVHHGYRLDADEDEQFCQSMAEEMDVDFYSTHLDQKQFTGSFENWAREQRYAFLNRCAREESMDWILTAHHLDDQIETLFMRHQQGSEWDARLGIRKKNGRVRRPMLDIRKSAIKAFAEDTEIRWRDDPTNEDIRFVRNRIRQIDLPDAIREDPQLEKKLLNDLINNQQKLVAVKDRLEKFHRSVLMKMIPEFGEITCNRDSLLACPLPDRKLLVQSLLVNIQNDDYITVTARHWTSLWQFIEKSVTGTIFELDPSIAVLRDRAQIIFYHKNVMTDPREIRLTSGSNPWARQWFMVYPYTDKQPSGDKNELLLSAEDFYKGVFTRTWQKGDRMKVYSLDRSVKLSDLFINNRISVLDKRRFPVVINHQGTIIWLPGIAHSVGSWSHDQSFENGFTIVWKPIEKR